MKQDTFWNGVTYCPFVKSTDLDPKYWERDLLTMRKLGINIIRPFVTWDRIEIEEGKRDWFKLDEIFRLCEKCGMKIILNFGGCLTQFGGCYPPQFLVRNPKVQQIVYDPVTQAKQYGLVRQLCPDDPIYHEKAMAFLKDCAMRYKDSPALAAWDLWNEAFFHEDGCFCHYTMAKFHNYLKVKYGTIDRLNKTWSGELPIAYQDWSEVEVVRQVSFTKGGAVPRRDWMAFNRLRVKGWLDDVEKIVRECDTRHLPITTNVATTAQFEGAFQHGWPSVFDQNRDMDIAGQSTYTCYAQMEEAPWMNSYGFTVARSTSVNPDSFWALETEAGKEQYLPNHFARVEKDWRTLSDFQLLGNGAKHVMYWKFGGRVADGQTDEFNLCGWDGSITDRAKRYAKFNQFCRDHEKLLLACKMHSDVAILYPRITEMTALAYKWFPQFIANCQGAYRLLHSLNIQCDFIDDEWIRRGRLNNYKVLIVPFTRFISEEFAGWMKDFTAKGGILIADRYFGNQDELTTQFQTAPGFGLQELTGVYWNDAAWTESPETIRDASGNEIMNVPDILHSHLNLTTAKSVAEFSDGGCAVSVSELPNGGAVMCWGIELFKEIRTAKSFDAAGELVRKFLAEHGISPCVGISGVKPGVIEASVQRGENGECLYFFANMTQEPQTFSMTLPEGTPALRELSGTRSWSGKPETWTFQPYECVFLGTAE